MDQRGAQPGERPSLTSPPPSVHPIGGTREAPARPQARLRASSVSASVEVGGGPRPPRSSWLTDPIRGPISGWPASETEGRREGRAGSGEARDWAGPLECWAASNCRVVWEERPLPSWPGPRKWRPCRAARP